MGTLSWSLWHCPPLGCLFLKLLFFIFLPSLPAFLMRFSKDLPLAFFLHFSPSLGNSIHSSDSSHDFYTSDSQIGFSSLALNCFAINSLVFLNCFAIISRGPQDTYVSKTYCELQYKIIKTKIIIFLTIAISLLNFHSPFTFNIFPIP